MNPFRVKIPIAILGIIFSISGCKKTEPQNILAITTDEILTASQGVYTFKGTIASIGKEEINEHGFCWSDSPNPEIDGALIRLGAVNSTGSFNSTVFDVLPGTTYYVKAFAIASSIPYFGDEKSFTTPDTLVPPVIDIDHNIYFPLKIGDQTWLNANLKTTHYPDGSAIEHIEDRVSWFFMPWYQPAYCWYDSWGSIADEYGNLYTWPAAMHINSASDVKSGNIQGVCPDGWHLPGDSEWKQLEMFLGMSQTEVDAEGWRGEDEGGRIKYEGTALWTSPNIGATNESGFGALPSGYRDGAGYFRSIRTSTRFWSSSNRGDYAWVRQLDNNSSRINRFTTGVYEGIPVRCLKDTEKKK
jgi:uncharacterized protein (TIGR02145 family)